MGKQQIGVIGLAVMGRNLALNIADHGYGVAAWNRSPDKTEELVAEDSSGRVFPTRTIEEFAAALELPRKIFMMVKAGTAVDDTISQLLPYISEGDILIDGGNSHYPDTVRRCAELEAKGIHFMGVGVSGGEEGARNGPAIMPGGDEAAYRQVESILTDISAKVDGEPCCTYIGADGAGHFVKMVHNGIEYGDMQLICEAYDILRNVAGLTVPELQKVFGDWNGGELNSYLVEITADILSKYDAKTGKPMVDVILDSAGQKGTGMWTSQAALEMGVAIPTITESVFQRYLSANKDERVAAAARLKGPAGGSAEKAGTAAWSKEQTDSFVETVRRALYSSKICAYAQGFSLMSAASKANGWNLRLGEIGSIFRGGCIIRAQFLNRIREAYAKNPSLVNLLMDDYFAGVMEKYQSDWRLSVSAAITAGVPVPAFSSALSYYDGYRSETLPMNLLQAQRDYFGAHTFRRNDREGIFHNNWQE
ncbi:MAG: NADP-dependent phosphogluconate dehydrogenase [Clostridiales bacterium]|nr:NADP-dependent phosphogluconate dehydrogenase [Clostridiales bacterium]